MGLLNSILNKTNEVHFLKENSDIERQVEALRILSRKFPSNKKIKDELVKVETGLKGENEVKYYLKNSNINMYVLHDITLAIDDLKAQIDYIIITQAKCYFVECKNMMGKIKIDNNGQFIREYTFNGKKVTEAIESPLRQSERHRDILLKVHNKKKTLIDSLFFNEEDFERYHKPIVVFTNKKAILDNKYAPKECKERVLRVDELVNYIKKDLKSVKLLDKDSDKSMREYAMCFLNASISNNIDYLKKYEEAIICPKCGGELIERKGYSTFIGCTNYPKCDYTRNKL